MSLTLTHSVAQLQSTAEGWMTSKDWLAQGDWVCESWEEWSSARATPASDWFGLIDPKGMTAPAEWRVAKPTTRSGVRVLTAPTGTYQHWDPNIPHDLDITWDHVVDLSGFAKFCPFVPHMLYARFVLRVMPQDARVDPSRGPTPKTIYTVTLNPVSWLQTYFCKPADAHREHGRAMCATAVLVGSMIQPWIPKPRLTFSVRWPDAEPIAPSGTRGWVGSLVVGLDVVVWSVDAKVTPLGALSVTSSPSDDYDLVDDDLPPTEDSDEP
uniref:Uncharacterized protein n=1 Tax=Nufsystermes virus TaxID=2796621 RepID=A0A7T7K9I6_9VIRU|nr:hypothetical protein [Nufsystermes virus]